MLDDFCNTVPSYTVKASISRTPFYKHHGAITACHIFNSGAKTEFRQRFRTADLLVKSYSCGSATEGYERQEVSTSDHNVTLLPN